MSSIRDAKISSEVASEYDKPIWLNFSLSDKCDGTLRSGESLKDALEQIKSVKNLEAILFNCCSPESISHALPILSDYEFLKGAYPNSFTNSIDDEYR